MKTPISVAAAAALALIGAALEAVGAFLVRNARGSRRSIRRLAGNVLQAVGSAVREAGLRMLLQAAS